MSELRITLAPIDPGRPFTSREWTAEIDWTYETPVKLRDLVVRAPGRAEALAAIKRAARAHGYRGRFTWYTEAWRHY